MALTDEQRKRLKLELIEKYSKKEIEKALRQLKSGASKTINF